MSFLYEINSWSSASVQDRNGTVIVLTSSSPTCGGLDLGAAGGMTEIRLVGAAAVVVLEASGGTNGGDGGLTSILAVREGISRLLFPRGR